MNNIAKCLQDAVEESIIMVDTNAIRSEERDLAKVLKRITKANNIDVSLLEKEIEFLKGIPYSDRLKTSPSILSEIRQFVDVLRRKHSSLSSELSKRKSRYRDSRYKTEILKGESALGLLKTDLRLLKRMYRHLSRNLIIPARQDIIEMVEYVSSSSFPEADKELASAGLETAYHHPVLIYSVDKHVKDIVIETKKRLGKRIPYQIIVICSRLN